MTHFKRLVTVFLCVALLLISCSSSHRVEGYVYFRQNANPTTLDPALIVDVPGAAIASKLFNGLVRLSDDLNIAPDIAEKWEVSKDGLLYRFFIRRGVKFYSGQEVTARDFKYSFERILAPTTKSPNTWILDKVKGAVEFGRKQAKEVRGFRVISDYVFEIELERPFSPFLSMLTMTAAYVVPEKEVMSRGQEFSGRPVGTGPFYLKQWLPGRDIVLQRNPDYFDVKAAVKGIVYRIIPEDLTAVTEFELGNLDLLSLPASAYDKFINDPKWRHLIVSMKGLNTYYLGFNVTKAPCSDINFRRAVSYAIDREKIFRTFFGKRGRLAAGPVPDLLRKWPAGPMKEQASYDPAMAREILKKAGLYGVTVEMYVTADQEVVDLSEILQAFLADAGIVVKIKQLEWSAYKQAVNSGEPHMFWLSWWADYPEAENFLFPLFHSSNAGPAGNRTRYVNKELDALVEKGQRTVHEEERNGYYGRAEEIIIREAPLLSFWHKNDIMVKQPWIKGFKVCPIYSMDKGTEITIIK